MLILHGPSSSGQREVSLLRTPMWIGRDPSNDIVLADPMASRHHAVVERRGDRYYLRDCNSTNGFTVNGDRLSERGLQSGDLLGIGSTRLVYWEGAAALPGRPTTSACSACHTVVALPARFCCACGSPLTARGRARGPQIAELTGQQVSLIRATVLDSGDYLERSYVRDPETGTKTAHSLEANEWSRFTTAWAVDPLACIRAINRAIARLRSPARIRRYLEAAVDLETLMDRRTVGARARVLSGIPAYIMDGYTDMGRNPSGTDRGGREKVRVDKERLRAWLVERRFAALAGGPSLDVVLAGFYEAVRRSLAFDEARVKDLSSESMDQTVNLSRFLEDGIGLCRHHSILYQLGLQEAAIPARVVKGALHVYGLAGRHAWNLAWFGGRVALIDVTLPTRLGPMIVVGSSLEEVYRLANRDERRYLPTPDQQNHYKVGAPVSQEAQASSGGDEVLAPLP